MKLDSKDRKILFELSCNARQHNTTLGKKLGLKPDVLQYRIDRLVKERVITSFSAYLNFHKLGYIDFGLYISSKLDKKKEVEFMKKTEQHKNVSYFSKVGGTHKFIIGMLAKDPIQLSELLKEITADFEDFIEDVNILTRLELLQFPRKYFVKEQNVKKNPQFGGRIGQLKIDELDKKIVKLLSNNARLKITEIEKKVKQPHSTVLLRIKNLEKKEIITGYVAWTAPEKYNYQSYLLLMKTKNMNKSKERKLITFCQSHAQVCWMIKTLGSWDFEIGVDVENQEQLQNVIAELKDACPEIMRIDFLTIFKVLKYTLYPF